MPSDPWKRLRLGSLSLLALACSTAELARFPEGRPVIWRDDDARPFYTECTPDPEEPGHSLCVPETYVSPFAWDAVDNSVFLPISRALEVAPSREAINVNSLDEVPDSSWFENRIGRFAMTPAELLRGPCEGGPTLDPAVHAASWLIDQGKPNGANPGFRIRSEERGKFMLKADLGGEPERATAAAAIAARLYYAAGYFTPCDSVDLPPPVAAQAQARAQVRRQQRPRTLVRSGRARSGAGQCGAPRGSRPDVGLALVARSRDRPLYLCRSARG